MIAGSQPAITDLYPARGVPVSGVESVEQCSVFDYVLSVEPTRMILGGMIVGGIKEEWSQI